MSSLIRAAFVLALGLTAMILPNASADEGMWLFTNPPRKLLKDKYGFEPTAAWLEHVQKASIRFNTGGSGSFVSPDGLVQDAAHKYSVPELTLNQWGLSGDWTIGGERAVLNASDGGIVFRFHARDLHLVLGPGPDGKPVRFRVTVDGAAPGASHGADIDADGQGVVTGERLYQLIRQDGAIADRTFEIRFLDPGVQVFSFTFG